MLAGCDLEPMFERQELFPVAQVPLAHQLGPVPGGGQHLGEEELPVGDPTHHLLRGVRVPPRVGGLVEPVPQGQPGTSGLYFINLQTEEAEIGNLTNIIHSILSPHLLYS